MKVSGFTFIRNAIKYDYPVVEAIRSILPLCDEVVVAVGQSEDDTLDLVKSIDPGKVRIIETVWDDRLRKGGRVLAVETEKAFHAISEDADWAIYIQADEALHEDGLENVKFAMERWKGDPKVEALVFDYLHFYGSYDYVGDSRRWYRKEVRLIRNDRDIYSWRDAQGFQKKGRPLKAKLANATIHHYGWVRPPEVQQQRQEAFHKLWHDDQWVEEHVKQFDEFDYSQIDSLARYTGSHPIVMQERIEKKNWDFSFDPTRKKLSPRHRFLHFIEDLTGYRIGEFKNYKII